MHPCRWVEVFVLASCVAWVAGLEGIAKPTGVRNNVTKLVSAEFHPNSEGNLQTRCVVLTILGVPRRPQRSTNVEEQANNTTPSEPSCPPAETPTQVYDPESLFGAGAPPEVSLIREQAQNYFVAYNRERRFSKAQVLGMVLVAMMTEGERFDDGLNLLKSQIELGRADEPRVMVVCLPDGSKEERIIEDCLESGGMGSKTSSTPPSREGDAQQNNKREIKSDIHPVMGNRAKSRDHRLTQTNLPPRQRIPPEVLASSSPPTAQSRPPEQFSVSQNDPGPPKDGQTQPLIQLSVSGIIRAVLPLSISKMTAQLSLSLAPVAQTASFVSTSTSKPNTSKLPSFLKPLSTKVTESPSTSAMTPTTADDILPRTAVVFTSIPQPGTSSTAAVATSSPITPSIPLKSMSASPSFLVDSTASPSTPTTSSAVSPTPSSELPTQSNTTLPSSEPLR